MRCGADTEIDAQVEIDEDGYAAYRSVPTSGVKIVEGTTDA